MAAFYNQGDQEIYKNFQYIPQEKYRKSFTAPNFEAEEINKSFGIPATNAFANSGGDGFSVYNADPNTITNRNPNKYALQDARYANELSYVGKNNQSADPNIMRIANFDEVFGPKTFTDSLGKERTVPGEERFNFPGGPSNALYSTETEAIKNMEMYPGYYGIDTIGDKFELDEKGELVMDSKGNYIRKNQPSKYAELISKGIDFIPGIGAVKKGAEFLSNVIGPYMPINRRAIMENQAGLDGVRINNIGQIVLGQGQAYDTPQGIMAGHNYNQMTEKTFDKKQAGIEKTLRSKYDFNDDDMDNLNKGIVTADMKAKGFNETMSNTYGKTMETNLISNYINVGIAKKNFTDTLLTTDKIVDIRKDTKDNKKNKKTTTTETDTTTTSGDGDNKGDWGGHGSVEAYDDSQQATYDRAIDRHRGAEGGRVGYFYGGRASMSGRKGLAPGGPAGGASAGGNYGGNVNPNQEYAGNTFEETYGNDNNQNNVTTIVPKTNYIDLEPKLLRTDPYINFSAKTPLELAKLNAAIGFNNIFDNDDLSVEGDLTTNIGPVTTNTDFTEEGVGDTDITYGNFSTKIDPNKNIQSIGYNNSWNGINYGVNTDLDNTTFTAGLKFKNGGLASIL
jgi:hypothetical protein